MLHQCVPRRHHKSACKGSTNVEEEKKEERLKKKRKAFTIHGFGREARRDYQRAAHLS